MEPSNTRTSVVLVDHRFKALTDRFLVETTSDDNILDLKEKVKETFQGGDDIPQLNSTDVAMLTVWKTMGTMVINTSSHERMAEILRAIDVDDRNTIRPLPEELKLADLGLSNFQTLLIQLPAVVTDDSPVGDVITKDVDPEYIDCYLKAYQERNFTYDDLSFNKISETNSVGAPEFVAKHERILSQKRMLAPEIRVFAGMIDEGLVAEYFCLAEESSESTPIVNLLELQHLVPLPLLKAPSWRTLFAEKESFTVHDAYWLLFSAVTDYYETITSIDDDGNPIITVRQSLESWPYYLLVEAAGKYHTYRPRSDFLLLNYGLPRLAVMVNSTEYGPRVDFIRLMLQGASVVRFANTKLDAYKEEKNFVFVAIYIDNYGQAERYLLYQDEKIDPGDPHHVYWRQRNFKLANANERMRFALELYNLSSTWHDDKRTKEQVNKLKAAVNNSAPKLLAFTTGSKRPATDTGGDPSPRMTKSIWTDDGGGAVGGTACGATRGAAGRTAGDAAGRLEESGYEVVSDFPETDGGTWGSIDNDKLPPHIRIVYRRDDPNKTKYIAKHLREGSNESAIHEYIHSRPSQSPNIISFIEVIPSTTREWLILPKPHSIRSQWSLSKGGVAGRVRLGWGLIKGLAYLHEHKIAHRDIKPGNLVRDRDFNLKIIDFDIAIKVEDENMEVKGYWGTEGWTAPEIGKEGGPRPTYSPIKADRWSCGRVILRHIMVGDTVMNADRRLLNFANRLIAKDPQQRPSLLESHVASVLHHSVSRSRQDLVDVDGQSMDSELPDAKRPRLE